MSSASARYGMLMDNHLEVVKKVGWDGEDDEKDDANNGDESSLSKLL